MTKIIHIIGLQGTGKSTLADAICKSKVAAGKTCVNLSEEGFHEPGNRINVATIRQGHIAPWAFAPGVFDFLIVEHLTCTTINDEQPGDMVIQMQRIEGITAQGN